MVNGMHARWVMGTWCLDNLYVFVKFCGLVWLHDIFPKQGASANSYNNALVQRSNSPGSSIQWDNFSHVTMAWDYLRGRRSEMARICDAAT